MDKSVLLEEEQQIHSDYIDSIEELRRDMFPRDPMDDITRQGTRMGFPSPTLGDKHREANDKLSKYYRDTVDNAVFNDSFIDAVNTGRGIIEIKLIKSTEWYKPMNKIKCDKCTSNVDRMSCPPEMSYQPDKCKICGSNPLLRDNFEAMPIPWPPEENQEIWCINAKGDIIYSIYNSSEWENLVNVYPTEEKAKTSRDVLINARELPTNNKSVEG